MCTLLTRMRPSSIECAPTQDDVQASMVESPCKLKPKLGLLLKTHPHAPSPSQDMRPRALLLLLPSQVKNESQFSIFPPLASLWPNPKRSMA